MFVPAKQIVFRKSELKCQKSISFHFEEIWQRFLATTKGELYLECTQSKNISLWPQRVFTLPRVEIKQTGNCNLPSINKTGISVKKTPHISSTHDFLEVGRTKGFTKYILQLYLEFTDFQCSKMFEAQPRTFYSLEIWKF